MKNKSETRPVQCEADLDLLIAGDRVMLDLLGSHHLSSSNILIPMAYERRVGQKVTFLGRNPYDPYDRTRIVQFSFGVKSLSYDTDGVVVASSAKSRTKHYDSSSSEYKSKLAQLRKAGI